MAIFNIFKKRGKGKGATSATPTTVDPPKDASSHGGEAPPRRPGPAVNGAVNDLAGKSPEELCGISAEMPRDEMKAHLAKLFKRHNRGASSLDENTRQLAEQMLDAIVEVRTKYLN